MVARAVELLLPSTAVAQDDELGAVLESIGSCAVQRARTSAAWDHWVDAIRRQPSTPLQPQLELTRALAELTPRTAALPELRDLEQVELVVDFDSRGCARRLVLWAPRLTDKAARLIGAELCRTPCRAESALTAARLTFVPQ
jgi:hypothetical protein